MFRILVAGSSGKCSFYSLSHGKDLVAGVNAQLRTFKAPGASSPVRSALASYDVTDLNEPQLSTMKWFVFRSLGSLSSLIRPMAPTPGSAPSLFTLQWGLDSTGPDDSSCLRLLHFFFFWFSGANDE